MAPAPTTHYGTPNGPACGQHFTHDGISCPWEIDLVTCRRCLKTAAYREARAAQAPRCATPHHVWTEGARLCQCGTFDRGATLQAGALVRAQEQHATLVGTETDGAPILEWCPVCLVEGHDADDCPERPE